MAPGAEKELRDGSAAHPFASPQEAQQALRARMVSEGRGGWTVEIAPGDYPLSGSLTFTPEDSGLPDAPVVWRGPADGSAHIVGARDLAGWRVRPDGRWEADVPVIQKERYQTLEWFEQLYVNGRRVQRARHPNAGFLPVKSATPTLLAGDLELMEKDASFHQHFGKGNILRNNILAFSRQGQIALSRPERHLSITAERNVVYWDSGPVFTKYVGTLRETGRIAWKGNFWWMTSGEPSFNRKTFAQWQAKGNDRDGLVADPLFFDAAKRDFRLKPESPVVKAGFRPFDIGAAGVRPLCHGCPNSSD